jgi:hypothetical protein
MPVIPATVAPATATIQAASDPAPEALR